MELLTDANKTGPYHVKFYVSHFPIVNQINVGFHYCETFELEAPGVRTSTDVTRKTSDGYTIDFNDDGYQT